MIKSTSNYEMFKFREDNRDGGVKKDHVKKIKSSIESRNLLHLKPILVNEDMEIIDGQHRLIAAKELGVNIFYKVERELHPEDIIKLNVVKTWNLSDYLNFYCVHKKSSYLLLKNFMDAHNLSLRISLCFSETPKDKLIQSFKDGTFEFQEFHNSKILGYCSLTIDLLKSLISYTKFTESSRFWKALSKLFVHPDFSYTMWKETCKCFA